ncbi:MAG: histidine kinase dimerization/phospho-acceptor domain-containing protein [Candidatus Zixiibacteriota bacterium]
MDSSEAKKYQSLRKILLAPTEPKAAESFLQESLLDAVSAMGLAAGSITVVDEKGEAIIEIREGEPALVVGLSELESRMIASLRAQFGLETIYSTLNHNGLKSIFSYIIKSGDRVIGAVSGICEGARNIALEQEFIEVMAAALRNSLGQAGQIKSARLDALRETTATINHEINNPLTVVLGNCQLLLMKADNLPDDVVKRLRLIEQSSLRIRDVVSQLMKLDEARSTTYVEGTRMIDIQGSKDSEE